MNETWKKVNDCHYSVSNLGRVRNDLTNKIKALRLDKYGYTRIDLYKDGKPIRYRLHRLVAEVFIPNPSNKPQINHKNGNKMDNSVSNLEWATAKENIQHSVATGLYTVNKAMLGKNNPNAGRHGKPIKIIETGEIFNSITDCANAIGGNDTGIFAVLSGDRKSHRGYTFERIT